VKDRTTARNGRGITAENWAVYLLEERIEIKEDLFKRGWKDWDEDTGVVYFIQAGKGPIKIGYTAKPPRQRLAALQSTNAERLELLAVIPGNRALEQRMHYVFKKGRILGEWFKPGTVGLQEAIGWAQERLI
jgi:hypothetical protein